MTLQTEPFIWSNNVNTNLQLGPDGTAHNLGYLDADWGDCIGPTDPRMHILHNTWVDTYRPQIDCTFDEITLDPKCAITTWGSGSYSLSKSQLILQTGTTINSGVELTMPNVYFPFVPGSRMFVYLETVPNGNLDLQFGIRSSNGAEYARFRRVDSNSAGMYYGETSHGGSATNAVTVLSGDSVRRPFVISRTADDVTFYTSNEGGQNLFLTKITTNLPTGDGVPFIRFSNTYGANRTLRIDDIKLMPIK